MTQRWTLPFLAVAMLSAAVGVPRLAKAETALITGANSGLGLEFVRHYAAKGWAVIATHRRSDMPETLAAVVAEHPRVSVERMDVADMASVRALATKLT